MSPLQLKIIYNAVTIRVQRGEDIMTVINSYEKLSQEEKDLIYKNVTEQL